VHEIPGICENVGHDLTIDVTVVDDQDALSAF